MWVVGIMVGHYTSIIQYTVWLGGFIFPPLCILDLVCISYWWSWICMRALLWPTNLRLGILFRISLYWAVHKNSRKRCRTKCQSHIQGRCFCVTGWYGITMIYSISPDFGIRRSETIFIISPLKQDIMCEVSFYGIMCTFQEVFCGSGITVLKYNRRSCWYVIVSFWNAWEKMWSMVLYSPGMLIRGGGG